MRSRNSSSSPVFAPQGRGCFGKMGIPPWHSDLLSLGHTCKEGRRGSGRKWPSHKEGKPWSCHVMAHHCSGACPIWTWQTPSPGLPHMAPKEGNPVICNLFYKSCSQERRKRRQDCKTYICPGNKYPTCFPGHFIICCPILLSSGIASFSMSLKSHQGGFGAETEPQMWPDFF